MPASNGRKGRNGKKVKKWVWAAAALAVFAGAGMAIKASLKTEQTIEESKLAVIERGDLARSVVATGKVEPLTKVEVKSKASGIVKELLVDAGDRVRRGQVLAELDKEELSARVREARAALVAAEAAFQAAEAAFERNKVEAAGPDLPFLQAAAERAQSLHRQGLIAPAAREEAEKAYQLALNKQLTAQRNVAVSRAEVARAGAQVAQAKAFLERAEEDLRNATIVSPMDGLVLSRDVEVGDAVSSILVLGSQATLVMTLGDVSRVYVKGKVDEADIGKVFLGQRARIVVESFPGKNFEGKVTKISPLGKEKDNVTTFEVRVSIDNPAGELKANMTANAEIILEEKKGVLLVPEAAVIYDKDRAAFVEIPAAGAPKGRKRIPVKVGISNGVKTELVADLRPGAQVILP